VFLLPNGNHFPGFAWSALERLDNIPVDATVLVSGAEHALLFIRVGLAPVGLNLVEEVVAWIDDRVVVRVLHVLCSVLLLYVVRHGVANAPVRSGWRQIAGDRHRGGEGGLLEDLRGTRPRFQNFPKYLIQNIFKTHFF